MDFSREHQHDVSVRVVFYCASGIFMHLPLASNLVARVCERVWCVGLAEGHSQQAHLVPNEMQWWSGEYPYSGGQTLVG